MNQCYLAADIGASGGRLMLGECAAGGTLMLTEIHRFPNGYVRRNGHFCWEYDRILDEILLGMKKCKQMGKIPVSLGIDTWGVDFALLDAQGRLIGDTVAYRDPRTAHAVTEVSALVPDDVLYAKTGIQKQPFNTIYQLWTVKEQLAAADRILMAPDYLNYLLTGVAMQEYTNATTTGLVSAAGKGWDAELLETLCYPPKAFGTLQYPGTIVGTLRPDIAAAVGFDCKVVLPATHDTASAVAAAPLDDSSIYISSGTWSLIGVENSDPITSNDSRLRNFTNEGGVEFRYRYLKNIMGLWMIQELRRELGEKYSFDALAHAAETEAADFPSLVDVNNARYLAPERMSAEIVAECRETGQPVPNTPGEFAACIYRSLARAYGEAAREIGRLTGKQYDRICIVGGGCQADFLNRLTAEQTGLRVTAGPVEATALGNILVQMMSDKTVQTLCHGREIIQKSFDIKEVTT